MRNRMRKQKMWKLALLVTLFIVALNGAHILWIHYFQSSDQPYAVNGQLDLRKWDAAQGKTIALDGEWEFYPHVFIDGIESADSTLDSQQYIQVPGKWNEMLEEGNSTPYGYGTYRLQILVNPDNDYTYSIRVSSVRSSSALYVNGRFLNGSGQPAITELDYFAHNQPYSVSVTEDEDHIIEVVVQVANFKDPRHSGIVRSLKFGTEASVAHETHLSTSMQQLTAIVFLMHAVYAIVLYIVGSRDRRFIYFSLITINAMIMILLGSEEKILYHWIPLGYEEGFRIIHLAMVGLSYFIVRFIMQQLSGAWRKLMPWYSSLCIIVTALTLILPVEQIITIQFIHYMLLMISIILTIVTLFYTALKQITESLILLFSFIAFTSHLAWWGISLITGIKVVYYPFDLIITIACFAIVLFRKYFQIHHETKSLAAKLQRMDQVKDEFLANTSHELRNPLHSISNILQSVMERERYSLNKKSIKDLESVQIVGRQMSYMLNDLLDTMSLKEGVPRLHLQRFSIQTIAAGVIDMFQFMIEGKPMRLVNRIPEHFPYVFADENRVIQIIYNLVHNAVKFTAEGEASISGYIKDNRAYIVISDTGIGIDEEALPHIFEPYERAHGGKSVTEGGFGLGLSICKQLVELHGGVLKVHSVPNQGTEFTFSLQLDEAATMQEAVRFETAEEPSSMASTEITISSLDNAHSELHSKLDGNAPRLLVVDDDPVNLKVLHNILSIEPYEIVGVTSGKQALERLETQEWDLVITDVMMPQMSGYELSRTIRQRFTITELPILLLTARSQVEDIENGFRSGANDYVLKPVSAIELRSRVKALTAVKQSLRERMLMESAWLQAQIQPHFLFNTLNSITALSESNLEQMRHLLEAFGNFLRDKYRFQNMDELAPLEEELSIVQSYVYIEQVRFEERLQVAWEIEEYDQTKIPMLTIQPLVENAIRHGIMPRPAGGQIVIKITNQEHYIEVLVIDNGVGMDEASALQQLNGKTASGFGVGLLNTDIRLKRLYGKGLQIESKLGEGTTVSFHIPK